MMMTDMVDTLRTAGLTACLPGQYDGPCKAPYVIVSDAGVTATGKTCGYRTFYVTACVPIGAPMKLGETLTAAMTALEALRPALDKTGNISEEDIDEEALCRFRSAEYTALCSLV